MEIHARTAANRRSLADFFDALDGDQLETPSLCDAWTVREVRGRLVVPLTGGASSFTVQLVVPGARWTAPAPRSPATCRAAPSTSGRGCSATGRRRAYGPPAWAQGQLADGCVHLRDCARPLGLPDDADLVDWRLLLDWLPSGVPGLVPRRRARGLRLVADDQDWPWGSDPTSSGRSEALALTGRPAALAALKGRGVEILRTRLVAPPTRP